MTREKARAVSQEGIQGNIVHYDKGWLVGCLPAHQHRKVNLCQLWGRETGSVGKGWPTR